MYGKSVFHPHPVVGQCVSEDLRAALKPNGDKHTIGAQVFATATLASRDSIVLSLDPGKGEMIWI